jgi:hypothetical protein
VLTFTIGLPEATYKTSAAAVDPMTALRTD